MTSRWAFLTLALLLLPLHGHTQQTGSAFVGEWQGAVPGLGDARLVITAVGSGGLVEGRMEFVREAGRDSFTFAERADITKRTSSGVISGSALHIETALGGIYDLEHNGDRLTGTYVRGTTYKVTVNFRKS